MAADLKLNEVNLLLLNTFWNLLLLLLLHLLGGHGNLREEVGGCVVQGHGHIRSRGL